jgi:hypothetical protein
LLVVVVAVTLLVLVLVDYHILQVKHIPLVIIRLL